MVHNGALQRDSTNRNSTTEEVTRKYRSATKNMAEMYSFLSPILPTVEDSRKRIIYFREEKSHTKETETREGKEGTVRNQKS